MQYQTIRFQVDGAVATLSLDRPEARNALSLQMRAELDDVLPRLKAEAGKGIKALILTGANGHFCAGGDVKAQAARAAGDKGTLMEGRARLREAHPRLIELANLDMPVIVAVDGAAAGAGFSLALTGDFVLASERAFFVQSFGKLGLVPDWNSLYLLPRLVGLQKAKELVFTARRLPAHEAMALGIVHSVHKPEDLMAVARRMARKLAQASPAAIALSKNILNQSLHLDNRAVLEMEAMAQTIARDTDFHREAVRRFAAREPALFDWDAPDPAEPPAQGEGMR
ncbi:enoyl-CoA hydratase/isomerase family protein [Hydrogenophaga sp. BPS33]|uniref:enoyl-CoA hydratase/isomerase family protein n=1 Tax=Hydrogenophaga sp. BPS33 TaxID=2651974 RepID=UPI00131F77E8|nr:enoyl-CoA hydratase/isomerase family protein [Hydrogenophaga sp. BPS33]QHE83940.1 enoyl-CoA hydratase/isomerase family protein [Hydrogenophaga sp. BPS33]